MTERATVIAYHGVNPYRVTGKIVKRLDNGSIIIDDHRGVRFFATPDRIVTEQKPRIFKAHQLDNAALF